MIQNIDDPKFGSHIGEEDWRIQFNLNDETEKLKKIIDIVDKVGLDQTDKLLKIAKAILKKHRKLEKIHAKCVEVSKKMKP